VTNTEPELLIATNNLGKISELRQLFSGLGYKLFSLRDVGIVDEVKETGVTFEENASLKANEYSVKSGMLTLADDSGLEVDALDGAPGVLSARFAGVDATDTERNQYLLEQLTGVIGKDRSAKFRCVLALKDPGKSIELYEGECSGYILEYARGSNGFGYDPVFLLEGTDRTTAEISAEEKNLVSHRGKAARIVVEVLQNRLNE